MELKPLIEGEDKGLNRDVWRYPQDWGVISLSSQSMTLVRMERYQEAVQHCVDIETELIETRRELKEAVAYLRQGKAQFAPTTTNSHVDLFLERWKDL